MRRSCIPEQRTERTSAADMSKIELLRLLINQRLTEAAQEIFRVFGRTIAEYEEEISRSRLEIERQRRLLQLRRKPRVCLQLDGSALCEQQDWSSSVDLNKEPPPHVKEEEEEGEVEAQWSDEANRTSEQNDVGFQLERGRERKQENHHRTSSLHSQDQQDQQLEPRPGTSAQQTCSDLSEDAPEASGNGQLDCGELDALPPPEVVDSYICTICGRAFAQRGLWAKHVQVHRRAGAKVDKSYTCDICGKRLTRFDGYQKHLRVHTGEKPYSCDECGRRFSDNSNYKRHIRTHAAQRTPWS